MANAYEWPDSISPEDEKAIHIASLEKRIEWLEHENRSLKGRVQLERTYNESLKDVLRDNQKDCREAWAQLPLLSAAHDAEKEHMAKTIKELLEENEKLNIEMSRLRTMLEKAEPAPVVKTKKAVKAEPAPVVKTKKVVKAGKFDKAAAEALFPL